MEAFKERVFSPWGFVKKKLMKSFNKRPSIMSGNDCIKNHKLSSTSYTATLPQSQEDLIRIAEEELQEKLEWRDRDIQALRDLVAGEAELYTPTDDAFFLRFLRARKFDYDRAHHLIQQYYQIRIQYADLYTDFKPSSCLHVFEDGMQMILPKCDQYGRKVFIFCAGKWNTDKCTHDDIFRANQLCLEKAIQDETTQINGFVSIIDMKNLGMQHVRNFRPTDVKKLLSLIQDCFPGRFKGFHFLNEPPIFDLLFAIAKPFLSEKLGTRMHFHGTNMESLHQHITPEILPEEFGGHCPFMDNSEFVKSLVACEEEFIESSKYGYKSLPKQDSSLTNIHPVDGVVGTYYKRICID